MNITRRRPLTQRFFFSCLAAMALLPPARAANPGRDVGLRLLQAQVPVNVSLRRLECEQIARAVRGASLAHRGQVVQVLVAALSLDEWDAKNGKEYRLSCPCVIRLFHAAARAVPERTVTLLQTTEALYPDCAEGLTASLSDLDGKTTVAASSPTGNGDPNAPNDGDPAGNDPGNGDPGGFGPGGGTGPGFPGSPGFGGGVPSGGIALPTPVPIAVTVVVNG